VRRLLWLGVGAAVGVLVVRQVGTLVRAHAPSVLAGVGDKSAAGVLGWVGDFIAEVREGMAEREEQIHAAFARGESLADLADDGYHAR
jgi:hypothetical protein